MLLAAVFEEHQPKAADGLEKRSDHRTSNLADVGERKAVELLKEFPVPTGEVVAWPLPPHGSPTSDTSPISPGRNNSGRHTRDWNTVRAMSAMSYDHAVSAVPLITGLCALAGALGGVLLSALTAKWSHNRTIAAEDSRRWLVDRRKVYAAYLTLAEQLMREIDGIGTFLRYDDDTPPLSSEDDEMIRSDLVDYLVKWDDELQPLLGEIQLLASPEVVDLADRVAGALMSVTGPIELRQTFGEYFPDWFRTKDLIVLLRNSMRVELGLPAGSTDAYPARRIPDWPWLTERPRPEDHNYGLNCDHPKLPDPEVPAIDSTPAVGSSRGSAERPQQSPEPHGQPNATNSETSS
ncbi:hypothetical protein ACWCPQ_17485 [Nocardia sp. NPDC001965]